MKYKVYLKKRVIRRLDKVPRWIQLKFSYLVENLETMGPIQPQWQNYSKLSENRYHCHLSRKYVACWSHEKNTIIVEVYYVGSREDAPY